MWRSDDRSSARSAWSTMREAMANDAVAAGLGALRTCRLVGVDVNVKSTVSLRPHAWTAPKKFAFGGQATVVGNDKYCAIGRVQAISPKVIVGFGNQRPPTR